jgi:C4-type Zn-finger protein
MIQCKCGKTIEKVPHWLQGVEVEFICNNCPNRSTKNIAFVSLEPEVAKVKLDDDTDDLGDAEPDLDVDPELESESP